MGIRKRDRSREKLMTAAQRLLLEGGQAAVTVNDVARWAEMAPGSFYNYYRSREDLLDSVAALIFSAINRDLDAVTVGMTDPAAIVAASARQTIHWMEPGCDLGRLLFQSGVPLAGYLGGIRERFERDVRAGVAAGVFHLEEASVVVSMVAGGTLGILLDRFLGVLPATAASTVAQQVLIMLGVDRGQAAALSKMPVPLRGAPSLPLSPLALFGPIADAPSPDGD